MKQLCSYRRSSACPDAEIHAKQDLHCPDEVHNYGPACNSSFSFTDFEALFLHVLLVLSAAIGTSYVQDYP